MADNVCTECGYEGTEGPGENMCPECGGEMVPAEELREGGPKELGEEELGKEKEVGEEEEL